MESFLERDGVFINARLPLIPFRNRWRLAKLPTGMLASAPSVWGLAIPTREEAAVAAAGETHLLVLNRNRLRNPSCVPREGSYKDLRAALKAGIHHVRWIAVPTAARGGTTDSYQSPREALGFFGHFDQIHHRVVEHGAAAHHVA